MTKHEQAAKMRGAGSSIDEIMEHFGCSRRYAYQMVYRGKNPEIDRARQCARYRRKLPETRRKQNLSGKTIKALHLENREATAARDQQIVAKVKGGLTFREVAEALGVSRSTVCGVCKRKGVVARRDPKVAKRREAIVAKARQNGRAVIKQRAADPAWKAAFGQSVANGIARRKHEREGEKV